MPVRSMLAAALALAAAIALAAGCGNGDDDASATELTTSSLTKAQFVNQANKACDVEREELFPRAQAYGEETDAPAEEGTPQYAEAARAVFLPIYEAELDAVRKLGAPAGEKQRLEAALSAQQEAIDDVATQSVETFAEIEQAFGRASKLMFDYGLSGCSVGRPTGESR